MLRTATLIIIVAISLCFANDCIDCPYSQTLQANWKYTIYSPGCPTGTSTQLTHLAIYTTHGSGNITATLQSTTGVNQPPYGDNELDLYPAGAYWTSIDTGSSPFNGIGYMAVLQILCQYGGPTCNFIYGYEFRCTSLTQPNWAVTNWLQPCHERCYFPRYLTCINPVTGDVMSDSACDATVKPINETVCLDGNCVVNTQSFWWYNDPAFRSTYCDANCTMYSPPSCVNYRGASIPMVYCQLINANPSYYVSCGPCDAKSVWWTYGNWSTCNTNCVHNRYTTGCHNQNYSLLNSVCQTNVGSGNIYELCSDGDCIGGRYCSCGCMSNNIYSFHIAGSTGCNIDSDCSSACSSYTCSGVRNTTCMMMNSTTHPYVAPSSSSLAIWIIIVPVTCVVCLIMGITTWRYSKKSKSYNSNNDLSDKLTNSYVSMEETS